MIRYRVNFSDGREWMVQASDIQEVLEAITHLPGGEDSVDAIERVPSEIGLVESMADDLLAPC